MVKRARIRVQKLSLTADQLQYARKKADEEFRALVVWNDASLTNKKPVVNKK